MPPPSGTKKHKYKAVQHVGPKRHPIQTWSQTTFDCCTGGAYFNSLHQQQTGVCQWSLARQKPVASIEACSIGYAPALHALPCRWGIMARGGFSVLWGVGHSSSAVQATLGVHPIGGSKQWVYMLCAWNSVQSGQCMCNASVLRGVRQAASCQEHVGKCRHACCRSIGA